MLRVIFTAVTVCFMATSVCQANPEVKLIQDGPGLKVMIGEDVFTVFRYDAGQHKPYFLPVSAENSYATLEQSVQHAELDSTARQVIVAADSATLRAGSGNGKTFRFADVLTVEKLVGNEVWISGENGWIARDEIVPFVASVTRRFLAEPVDESKLEPSEKYDHPHHIGIWFAVDEVNDLRFWFQLGKITVNSVHPVKSGGEVGAFEFLATWSDQEGRPVLLQNTTVTITGDRLLTFDATLTAASETVHIGDTKEGMFAIRLNESMKETISKGPVTTSDGTVGANAAWGKTASWMNYVGKVHGNEYAVAIFDSGTNPWKSRYHIRDYGLFAVSPFGDGSYTQGQLPAHSRDLKRGDSLRFRYGLWVHPATNTAESIQSRYEKFDEQFVK